ncbi:MAG: phosphate acyltransferase, partial [candidate division Zixibacteria bacterium]
MNALSVIKDKAKQKNRTVVLPEGAEPRVVKAAKIIREKKMARVTRLGDPKEIERLAAENNLDLSDIEVINPVDSPDFDSYVNEFVELRK